MKILKIKTDADKGIVLDLMKKFGEILKKSGGISAFASRGNPTGDIDWGVRKTKEGVYECWVANSGRFVREVDNELKRIYGSENVKKQSSSSDAAWYVTIK